MLLVLLLKEKPELCEKMQAWSVCVCMYVCVCVIRYTAGTTQLVTVITVVLNDKIAVLVSLLQGASIKSILILAAILLS